MAITGNMRYGVCLLARHFPLCLPPIQSREEPDPLVLLGAFGARVLGPSARHILVAERGTELTEGQVALVALGIEPRLLRGAPRRGSGAGCPRCRCGNGLCTTYS